MKEKLYEEVCAHYRFFLGWRHASLAGLVVIVAGALTMTASAYKEAPAFAFVIPLFAAPFGIVLWWIDVRTRDLYHAAVKAGKELEGAEKGIFTVLCEDVRVPKSDSVFSRFTQSGAMNTVCWLSSIGMLVLAVFLFFAHPDSSGSPQRPVPASADSNGGEKPNKAVDPTPGDAPRNPGGSSGS